MNIDIEKIKEYIKCPQFGDLEYGEWGALRLEQREAYRKLIIKIEELQEENEQLKKQKEELKEWLKENEDKINYMEDVLDKMNELEGVDNENN